MGCKDRNADDPSCFREGEQKCGRPDCGEMITPSPPGSWCDTCKQKTSEEEMLAAIGDLSLSDGYRRSAYEAAGIAVSEERMTEGAYRRAIRDVSKSRFAATVGSVSVREYLWSRGFRPLRGHTEIIGGPVTILDAAQLDLFYDFAQYGNLSDVEINAGDRGVAILPIPVLLDLPNDGETRKLALANHYHTIVQNRKGMYHIQGMLERDGEWHVNNYAILTQEELDSLKDTLGDLLRYPADAALNDNLPPTYEPVLPNNLLDVPVIKETGILAIRRRDKDNSLGDDLQILGGGHILPLSNAPFVTAYLSGHHIGLAGWENRHPTGELFIRQSDFIELAQRIEGGATEAKVGEEENDGDTYTVHVNREDDGRILLSRYLEFEHNCGEWDDDYCSPDCQIKFDRVDESQISFSSTEQFSDLGKRLAERLA